MLAGIGVSHGEKLRGKALATALVAHAADGYEALFSLGELDATRQRAGNPRDRVRRRQAPCPRWLTVNERPARSLRQLTSLEIR